VSPLTLRLLHPLHVNFPLHADFLTSLSTFSIKILAAIFCIPHITLVQPDAWINDQARAFCVARLAPRQPLIP